MRFHPYFSSFSMDQKAASFFTFRLEKRAGEMHKE
jgi:hypothetical protein